MLDEPFRGWLARQGAAPLATMQRGHHPESSHRRGCATRRECGRPHRVAPYVGLTVWLAGRLLDAYDDDMLARRSYASPAFGGYRDITPDMLAYSAMAIAFAIANAADQFPWLSILAGDVMASFLLAPSGCCESGSAMIAVSVFPRSRRAWRILAP